MLTQEQINEDWTVRSDNYNNYVEEEFATNRPEKWLELIESQAPAERPLRILDAGCGPGFFPVVLGAEGVETHVPISLNEDETTRLIQSAETLRRIAEGLEL